MAELKHVKNGPYLRLDTENLKGVLQGSPYKRVDYNQIVDVDTQLDEDLRRGFLSALTLPDPIIGKRIWLPSGDVNAPALSWAHENEQDSGLYRIAADNYGQSVGGTLKWDWDADRILLADGYKLGIGEGSPAHQIHITDSGADVAIVLEVSGATAWSMAIDDDDSDSWKLSPSSTVGSTPAIVATTGLDVQIPHALRVGTASSTTPQTLDEGDVAFGSSSGPRIWFDASTRRVFFNDASDANSIILSMWPANEDTQFNIQQDDIDFEVYGDNGISFHVEADTNGDRWGLGQGVDTTDPGAGMIHIPNTSHTQSGGFAGQIIIGGPDISNIATNQRPVRVLFDDVAWAFSGAGFSGAADLNFYKIESPTFNFSLNADNTIVVSTLYIEGPTAGQNVDADGTLYALNINGNVNVSGVISGATYGGLTASRFVVTDGSGHLTAHAAFAGGNQIPYATGSATLAVSPNLTFDGTVLTAAQYARVGSATDASAQGDFSCGVGADRIFYDESKNRLWNYGGSPSIWFNETDQGVDAKNLAIIASGGEFRIELWNDAINAGSDILQMTGRSTTRFTQIRWNASRQDTDFRWDWDTGRSFFIEGSSGLAVVDQYLRVGSATDASSQGDFSAGLSAGGIVTFDASAGILDLMEGATIHHRVICDGTSAGAAVFNSAGQAGGDFRAEGGSLPYMLFLDATVATENIALLATAAPDWQSMDRGIFIGDTSTAPTGNPTSGGYMYSNAGAGTWRGSGGTVTAFGPAGPHCERCGYDAWRVAHLNTVWRSYRFECSMCGAVYRGGPEEIHDLLTPQQKREYIRQSMTYGEVASLLGAERSGRHVA